MLDRIVSMNIERDWWASLVLLSFLMMFWRISYIHLLKGLPDLNKTLILSKDNMHKYQIANNYNRTIKGSPAQSYNMTIKKGKKKHLNENVTRWCLELC